MILGFGKSYYCAVPQREHLGSSWTPKNSAILLAASNDKELTDYEPFRAISFAAGLVGGISICGLTPKTI